MDYEYWFNCPLYLLVPIEADVQKTEVKQLKLLLFEKHYNLDNRSSTVNLNI